MYAQVVRPQGNILDLEKKFVRLLITNMADGDVGLFDFDFDTTFAVMVLNHEGQVYLRYGGRDAKSPESFVSQASFETALNRGQQLHEAWQAGELTLPDRGESKSPLSYPFVRQAAGRRCVHCHDVASGKAIELFHSPEFKPQTDIWVYPDPANLGLMIDPEDGATLLGATGPAGEAGLKTGDRIVSLNQQVTSTYSDIQYHLHRLPESQSQVTLALADGRAVELPLPRFWRHSDITWRRLGIRLSPSAGFGGSPISDQQKKTLGLPENGIATKVSFLNFPRPAGSPLHEGDIVFSVNGTEATPYRINHAALYISLFHELDETVRLGVIRNGKRMEVPLTVSASPSEDERVMDSDGRRRGKGGKGKGRRGMGR